MEAYHPMNSWLFLDVPVIFIFLAFFGNSQNVYNKDNGFSF